MMHAGGIHRITLRRFALALLVAGCGPWQGEAVKPGRPADPKTATSKARRLEVGPGKKYSKPSAAARAARDGDIIEIAAGVYKGDAAIWRRNNLIIRGVGGRAKIEAHGAEAEGKGIWVIKGRHTTVENIELSGARVRDRNGAGIRQEGAGLIVRNCYFYNNQNGILTNHNAASEILIEHSEFNYNGDGDGRSHNIYIGKVKRFTLRASYSHHTEIGHNVKSRAAENYILYNRVMDETTGNASYAIDLPNGGVSYVIGNLIQQGPKTDNNTIVAYGKEGLSHPGRAFYFINNTVVNDGPSDGTFLFVQNAAEPVAIVNNIFAGPGTVVKGAGTPSHNLHAPQPGLVNRAAFDYHLEGRSAAIDAGIDPGVANGFALIPTQQYVHQADTEARPVVGAIDLGAYEFSSEPRASD
jgi:hypothetical protein